MIDENGAAAFVLSYSAYEPDFKELFLRLVGSWAQKKGIIISPTTLFSDCKPFCH